MIIIAITYGHNPHVNYWRCWDAVLGCCVVDVLEFSHGVSSYSHTKIWLITEFIETGNSEERIISELLAHELQELQSEDNHPSNDKSDDKKLERTKAFYDKKVVCKEVNMQESSSLDKSMIQSKFLLSSTTHSIE